jgi:3-hydroxybutyryl-CoA dehydrogenase
VTECCIVNEAAFALGEGVGSAEDIDAGVELGLNWPKGSLELGREIGFDRVQETLDELHDYYREERYRAAPLLRRWGTDANDGTAGCGPVSSGS